MKIKTGIYRIKNIVTEKVYVGSAINIFRRWNEHNCDLIKNSHHSQKLQNSFNKHGVEKFVFEVIEECSKELLIEREQYWIDVLNSYNNGYNSTPKAGSCLGVKHSEATRKKRSLLNMGNKFHLGHKHSDETKILIAKIFSGITYEMRFGVEKSNYIKNKMSESKMGDKNPAWGRKGVVTKGFTGKKHSKDVVDKVSKINKNNKYASGIKIKLLDQNDNIINKWDTINSCIKELGISRKIINKIIKEGNTQYGYKLIYG